MKIFIRGLIIFGLACGFAFSPVLVHSYSSRVMNLGEKVNSPESDFAPIVSPDGEYLYFASDRAGGKGGQDIWVSRRQNGEWQKPENLGAPINDNRNQGPDSFVQEGNTLILYLTYCNPSGAGLCDIYISRKVGAGGWSVPEKLPEPINTKYSDANASWDYDRNVLYFVSTRPGGMPGPGPKKMAGESSYDIWMCQKKKDGSWGEPQNLGSPINTPGWEGVAFYHSADQSLYFSSDGHGGKGKADIFRSRQIAPGKWSVPEPVEAVNTPENDLYLSIPAAGNLAYFSSDTRGTYGLEDIYVIPLDDFLPPETIARRTKQIPVAEKKAVGPAAGHIETVYFDFDRSDIRPGETVKLDKVAEFMEANPTVRIEVAGHACSVGKQDYNLVLSKNRAESVKKYLVSKGISPDRIVVSYYGETRPAEPNDPSKGNPLNRRVEISILQ